jgi:hypothetical protein
MPTHTYFKEVILFLLGFIIGFWYPLLLLIIHKIKFQNYPKIVLFLLQNNKSE